VSESESMELPIFLGTNANLLSDSKLWGKIDPQTLKDNLHRFVSTLSGSVPDTDSSQTGYSLKEFEVSLTIGAKGQVGFLGTGVEGSGEASLTLKFVKG
jgi:hypothetical protein